jgi:peptidoglycan hydrolase CwlO-like protein
MTDYDKMLVDLLNDKIRQWERKCSEQRKEINKLKAEIRELKKGVNAVEE